MDDPLRWWQGALICLAAMLLMGFFYACELAAAEFNDKKLKTLSQSDERAHLLEGLLAGPSFFMRVNVISRIFMAAVITSAAVRYYYRPLKAALAGVFNIGSGTAYVLMGMLSALIIFCAVTAAVGTFCINIPRLACLSAEDSEGFILRFCGVYRIWLMIFTPIALLCGGISKGVLKALGFKRIDNGEKVTEEEILMMVDAVNETGGLEEGQAEMINNIFEFDDIEIKDVMTHRTEVVAIEENEPIKEAVRLAIESGFSRIPVFEGTVDNIEGVIYAKDLLSLLLNEEGLDKSVKDFMREIVYSPESRKCGELFKELTEEKIQMAVVVDEYGGTAGIVTLEDLIETIVGNIQDEYDDEVEEIRRLGEGVFEFEGNADYEEAMEALGKQPDENSPFETIGAMVIELLGRIPEEGETPTVKWENVKFSVLKAEDRKIERLRAELI